MPKGTKSPEPDRAAAEKFFLEHRSRVMDIAVQTMQQLQELNGNTNSQAVWDAVESVGRAMSWITFQKAVQKFGSRATGAALEEMTKNMTGTFKEDLAERLLKDMPPKL